jgi:hypothetical protein
MNIVFKKIYPPNQTKENSLLHIKKFFAQYPLSKTEEKILDLCMTLSKLSQVEPSDAMGSCEKKNHHIQQEIATLEKNLFFNLAATESYLLTNILVNDWDVENYRTLKRSTLNIIKVCRQHASTVREIAKIKTGDDRVLFPIGSLDFLSD